MRSWSQAAFTDSHARHSRLRLVHFPLMAGKSLKHRFNYPTTVYGYFILACPLARRPELRGSSSIELNLRDQQCVAVGWLPCAPSG